MRTRCQWIFVSCVLALLAGARFGSGADEPLFSGPQVGERILPFKARIALGTLAGQELDIVKQAGGKPIVLLFVHEFNRPSVGLTRIVMNYAAKRSADGLHAGVVCLSDDATETEKVLQRAAHALPTKIPLAVSLDGKEGPGAYGLNRNVTLTLLVAQDNKVTANFALVQPSVQADVPRIVKAIVDVLGGGPVPTLTELDAGPAEMPSEAEVRRLLGPVIRLNAQPEDVEQAAKAVEEFMAKSPAARQDIARRARTIVDAGKLADYGTPKAQVYLKKWSDDFGRESDKQK